MPPRNTPPASVLVASKAATNGTPASISRRHRAAHGTARSPSAIRSAPPPPLPPPRDAVVLLALLAAAAAVLHWQQQQEQRQQQHALAALAVEAAVADHPLSKAERARFEAEGMLVIPGALAVEEAAELNAALECWAAATTEGGVLPGTTWHGKG